MSSSSIGTTVIAAQGAERMALQNFPDRQQLGGSPMSPRLRAEPFSAAAATVAPPSLTNTIANTVAAVPPGEPSCSRPPTSPGVPYQGTDLKRFDKDIPERLRQRFKNLREVYQPALNKYILRKCTFSLSRRANQSKASVCCSGMKWKYLGESESTADLYIVVECEHWAAKIARRFFRKDHVLQDIGTDFRIMITERGLRKLMMPVVKMAVMADEEVKKLHTLCGRRLQLSLGVLTRVTTLGGIVMVTRDSSYSFYGLTAGHSVADVMREAEMNESSEETDTEMDEEAESTDSGIDSDSTEGSVTNAEMKTSIDELPGTGEERYEGCFEEHVGPVAHDSFQHTATDSNCDWALVNLEAIDPLPNMLNDDIELSVLDNLPVLVEDRVVALTGLGAQSGSLAQRETGFFMSPGKNAVETLDFTPGPDSSLVHGDSGAWVVNPKNGHVYGHLVAIDSFGEGYVVPIQETLKSIQKNLNAINVSLPSADMIECVRESDKSTSLNDNSEMTKLWHDYFQAHKVLTACLESYTGTANLGKGKDRASNSKLDPIASAQLQKYQIRGTDRFSVLVNPRRRRVWATRSRTGCATCRFRHLKCDETMPACTRCTSSRRKCSYERHVTGIPSVPVLDQSELLEANKYFHEVVQPRLTPDSQQSWQVRVQNAEDNRDDFILVVYFNVLSALCSPYGKIIRPTDQHKLSTNPLFLQAWRACYTYAAKVLHIVTRHLTNPRQLGGKTSAEILGYITDLFDFEVLAGEEQCWQSHARGYISLVNHLGGVKAFRKLSEAPLQSFSYLLIQCVGANTTSPAATQMSSFDSYSDDEIQAIHTGHVMAPFPCPGYILCAIHNTTRLRAQAASSKGGGSDVKCPSWGCVEKILAEMRDKSTKQSGTYRVFALPGMRELFQIALETYAFLTLHHLTGDQVHSPQWREASSMSCGQDRLRSDSQDRFRSDSQDEPISPFNDQFRNDSQDQYRSNIQDHFTSRTYDGTWSHSLELSMGRYPNLFGSDSQGPFTDPSYELLLRSDSQDQFMSNSQDQFRSDSQDSRFLCVKKLTGILREVCGTIDYEDRVALRWPAVVAGVALAEGGEDDRALVVEILTSMKSQLPNWGALWCLDKLKVFWESGKTEWEDCFDEPVVCLM